MTDRPILFSGPMVRALLAGQKTQTRRALAHQPPTDARYAGIHYASNEPNTWFFNSPTGAFKTRQRYEEQDRLWVRETHATFGTHGQHREDGQRWGPWDGLPTILSPDRTRIAYFREGFDRCKSSPWKPGIHMPRWASRLTLILTDVRVERLQDISEADALAEGVTGREAQEGEVYTAAYEVYAELWDGLNAKRGFGWDTNPWVVALTFEVDRRNIDAPAEAA